MIDNPIIFYITSVLIITFAFVALFTKNIINSLLASIVVFFIGSVFFYILGSEYNAIIQIAVYGLAVPIIIGLSIMFTSKTKHNNSKSFSVPYLTVLCAAIFILAFIYLLKMSLAIMPDTFHTMEPCEFSEFDTISAFAKGIFINYVWAFEMISLLLTIVIAGFTIIKPKKKLR